MQLIRLHLVNFRLHADTAIDFGPGITAVVGPNGAGKSTLLEGIAWALYGTPAARGGRDSIRRLNAPARQPVRVEVWFALGGHEYHVVRRLAGAEMFRVGEDVPLANSHTTVTAQVATLLGMTREEFFNTYFTGQKELAVLAALGPAERGRFLSRLMGYEKIRAAQERLRGIRTNLRGEVGGLEQGLEDPGALARHLEQTRRQLTDAQGRRDAAARRLEAADAHWRTLTPQWEAARAARERALSLQGELGMARQQVEESTREFERLDRELADALLAQQRLQVLLPMLNEAETVQEEFAALDRAAEAAGRKRILAGQLAETAAQLAELETRLQELADAPEILARADADRARVEGEHAAVRDRVQEVRTTWVRDRQDAETRHRTLQDQYRQMKEDLETLVTRGPDGVCPTCTRPLGEEYDVVVGTITRQLEEIASNGKFLQQRVQQLAAEPAELGELDAREADLRHAVEEARQALVRAEALAVERKRVEADRNRLQDRKRELEATVAALPDAYDVDRHDTLRVRLRELQATVVEGTALRVRADRAEDLGEAVQRVERDVTEREQRVAELERALTEAGHDEARYREVEREHAAADVERREAQLLVTRTDGDVKVGEAAVAEAVRRQEERDQREQRIRELRHRLLVHDALDEALDQLRQELNARLRPDISEVASTFLAELTDGRYQELNLDEQYRIVVSEDGVPKPVISGGEEDIANLVVRLAISQLVAERAGQPLSLLVLDEIFGSLDEGRRENVVNLLRGLAARFPQIILISHIEGIRDGVDRVLRVVVDERQGSATVTDDDPLPMAEDAAA